MYSFPKNYYYFFFILEKDISIHKLKDYFAYFFKKKNYNNNKNILNKSLFKFIVLNEIHISLNLILFQIKQHTYFENIYIKLFI